MSETDDEVDINIRNVPEELRNNFRGKAAMNGETYETFLRKLLIFYDEYKSEFEQMDFNRPPGRRR